MSEQLLKNFSIAIEQKVFEKKTPQGNLAVYQSEPFGVLLTINHEVIASEQDSFIFDEMMVHPALFSHTNPQKIALLGPSLGILPEILKHPTVKEVYCVRLSNCIDDAAAEYFTQFQQTKDERVHYILANPMEWLRENAQFGFDVIIHHQSSNFSAEHFQAYLPALDANGVLVKPCTLPYLNPQALKTLLHNVQFAGFNDHQTLNFVQPSFAGGRTVLLATKRTAFKYLREKDIFNRSFPTRFYNFDVHKASLALPEYMRIDG